jgi:hypothetical protein
MRRDEGRDAEIALMSPLGQVENGDQVSRIRIIAVPAVAINWRVSRRVIRRYRQFVHLGRKPAQYLHGFEALRIEEEDLVSHLVDGDQTSAASREIWVLRVCHAEVPFLTAD